MDSTIAVARGWPIFAARSPRPSVLLSLFDGAGMARIALDDLLRRPGAVGALAGSFFAEWDDR
eukprot:193749-Lingulodinium_polyedra.AAC.1